MKKILINVGRFLAHYLVSLINYGVFSFPIFVVMAFLMLLLFGVVNEDIMRVLIFPLQYVDEHNWLGFIKLAFFAIVFVFNLFFRVRILFWVTNNFGKILLGITVLFPLMYLMFMIFSYSEGDGFVWIFLFGYLATFFTTVVGLITTKIALIVHQLVDGLFEKV